MSLRQVVCSAFAALLVLGVSVAAAADSSLDGASIRDVLETEEKTAQLLEERSTSDPEGISTGDTPLATILALTNAQQARDWALAAEFLDLRYRPPELQNWTTEDLVQALLIVWAQHRILDIDALSDQPDGRTDDGLPPNRDLLGTLPLGENELPVYLQRIPDGESGHVWKISNTTVTRIPELWEQWGYGDYALWMMDVLPEFTFLGMESWQLVLTVLAFAIAWPAAMLLSSALMWIALRIPNGFPQGIQRFFRGPMRFFIFILLARYLIDQLNLSVTARIILTSSGITFLAFIVLSMGLLSLLRDQQIRKMQRAGNPQLASLLRPITTIVKLLLLTGVALFWADSAGYNMTTVLAGLGVGSLAVALAAQKTLENVFGAITLYLARPVSAGDFCRFGDITGTVEDIGLRSTVLRTLNRTRVVIPNSVFSATDVENYSARDRIRYFRYLRVEPAQPEPLRYLLAEVRRLLCSHPQIQQDTVSVRLEKIEDASALLRIDGGVSTSDFQVYLAVAEDINLHLLEAVSRAGLQLCGPSQSIVMRESEPAALEVAREVERTLAQWRSQDLLPFPDFNRQQLSELRASLDYPPGGSSTGGAPRARQPAEDASRDSDPS